MADKKNTHLNFEERGQIAGWNLEGLSQSEMGCRLGRSQSAISRELARNRLPSSGYEPTFAECTYPARREHEALIERDEKLERLVVDRLTEGWTPEPFAGWLKRGEEKNLRSLGTETIYRCIFLSAQGARSAVAPRHRARHKSAQLWKPLQSWQVEARPAQTP